MARPKKAKPSAQKRKASRAARKGWETRRAKARTQAARKGWATRKKKEAARRHLDAVRRGKKGWATRRARAAVKARLEALVASVELAQRLDDAGDLESGQGEELIAPDRARFHEAKADLWEACEYDADAYGDFLDELAAEVDVDWHISYGPGEE